MFNTVKLCEVRDCASGKFEPCPHNAIDPCKVFRMLDDCRWFYENTGDRVQLLRLPDGKYFNAELWLEREYRKALSKWTPNIKVHAKSHWRPKMKPAGEAKHPRFTVKELDEMASFYLKHRRGSRTMRERIEVLGFQIRALKRFNRKFGNGASIDGEIEKLISEQRALRQQQSQMDKAKRYAKEYAIEDREWEQRWVKTRGKDTVTVWLFTRDSIQYEIDNNGVLVDREYVYLPQLNNQFDECKEWASTNLHIKPDDWVACKLEDETIGNPLRRSGKKNTVGARIRARAAHRQYVADVKDIKNWLRWSKFSIWRFAHDDDMKALYERIKSQILSKTR